MLGTSSNTISWISVAISISIAVIKLAASGLAIASLKVGLSSLLARVTRTLMD